MQKEVVELKGKDVETPYLTPIDSGSRDSSVNSSQHRQNSEPSRETCTQTVSTASSSIYPTAGLDEEA